MFFNSEAFMLKGVIKMATAVINQTTQYYSGRLSRYDITKAQYFCLFWIFLLGNHINNLLETIGVKSKFKPFLLKFTYEITGFKNVN